MPTSPFRWTPNPNQFFGGHMLKRTITNLVEKSRPRDFTLLPNFFSLPEQRVLLATALQKLDATESRQFRRRRKSFENSRPPDVRSAYGIQDLFLPDEYYQFEEGHYDGVIHHFREMHVSSWPEDSTSGLSSILNRLRSLYPTQETQTHLLHLSSYGEILPHVDNVSASGSWILGVSLGAERVMRLSGQTGSEDSFDVLLPSGSVYLQKDTARYDYRHSILKGGTFGGRNTGGQRVSIMVRDRFPDTSPT